MKTIAIIGGGPAGYIAAIEAARAGMETILVESQQVGGVCVNWGCLPTKTCLRELKDGCPDTLDRLREKQEEVISKMRNGIRFMLQRGEIRFIEGKGKVEAANRISVLLPSGERQEFFCDSIILATGSQERDIHVPKGCTMHSLEDLVLLRDIPKEISILGGGVTGVELAVILQELGTQVRLVEKTDHVLPGWDTDIQTQMEVYLESRGILVITGSELQEAAHAVNCCGRIPHLPPLPDGIESIDSLWKIGDCGGVGQDAALAMEQGRRIIGGVAGNESRQQKTPPAKCIHTPLEAASAGVTCREAEQEGMRCVEIFHSLTYSPIGLMGGLRQGFIKAVMEKESHLLRGFHIMSPQASEIIGICQMAIGCQLTAEQFVSFSFPHPTEAEQLKEAVWELLRREDANA